MTTRRRTNPTGAAGFTLIEIIIVIAVIAILAGIATPSIVKNIQDSRIARARSDCKEIASAMAAFYKDLGRWPTTDGTNDVSYLKTDDGDVPSKASGVTGWTGTSDLFKDQLITNAPGYATSGEVKWDGPYQTEFGADPWNHAYLCNVGDLSAGSTTPVYVISAGPNGVLDTSSGSLLAGDDIGFRLQ
ncbi:MAG: prepilin-type N-terminal cleavage/methylation domain-containing protein [Nitrospirae bacterium]|nr:MAG: prepilin-type N-terminal cleavage/methylation domain-containing protein [Nitrospirota bacterium]